MSMFGSFLPSLGRKATTVYSGRGSRHCYEIKCRIDESKCRIDESTCPNARSGNPGVSCRTLGARDCGLLLRVIAATLAYRRQHGVLGRDGAVVGLTVLVEECVVLGTRIGTYV